MVKGTITSSFNYRVNFVGTHHNVYDLITTERSVEDSNLCVI